MVYFQKIKKKNLIILPLPHITNGSLIHPFSNSVETYPKYTLQLLRMRTNYLPILIIISPKRSLKHLIKPLALRASGGVLQLTQHTKAGLCVSLREDVDQLHTETNNRNTFCHQAGKKKLKSSLDSTKLNLLHQLMKPLWETSYNSRMSAVY